MALVRYRSIINNSKVINCTFGFSFQSCYKLPLVFFFHSRTPGSSFSSATSTAKATAASHAGSFRNGKTNESFGMCLKCTIHLFRDLRWIIQMLPLRCLPTLIPLEPGNPSLTWTKRTFSASSSPPHPSLGALAHLETVQCQ